MISFFLRLWSKISNTDTVFRVAESKKQIFLTFDDGPIPEVTPKVLDILKRYNAKATFFCVGDNIRKHPDCFEKLKAEGHSVGNHTMHHLKASKVDFDTYINDVEQCRDLCDSVLFRPPYGRLSSDLKQELKKRGFRLVLWSAISFDYDKKISQSSCYRNVARLRSGDIVLFHDSLKSEQNTLYALEKVLKRYSDLGFSFCALK